MRHRAWIVAAATLILLTGLGFFAAAQEPASAAGAEAAATPPVDPRFEAVKAEVSRLAAEESQAPAESGDPAPATALDPPSIIDLPAVLRVTAALLVILAVILLLYAVARRYGNRSPLLAGASLGTVLGRLYLNPKNSLHYVETGGRVLLIGITPTSMSLVAEFDASAFDATRESPVGGDARTVNFAEHLKAVPAAASGGVVRDADIASIQSEIARLRETLREDLGEANE